MFTSCYWTSLATRHWLKKALVDEVCGWQIALWVKYVVGKLPGGEFKETSVLVELMVFWKVKNYFR